MIRAVVFLATTGFPVSVVVSVKGLINLFVRINVRFCCCDWIQNSQEMRKRNVDKMLRAIAGMNTF